MIRTRLIRRILWAVVILITANFLVFVLFAGLIGGDAWNGRMADGHFFVANKGKLTEVSEATFHYSLWHVWSIFVTSPFMMLACILLNSRWLKRQGNDNSPTQSSN